MNLNIFNTTNLFEAATHLFQQLNIKLNSNTAEPLPVKDLLKQHYKDNDTFKAIDKTFFLGIIDDSVFKATGMFDINYSYKEAIDQGDKNYNGLMLFALELKKQPTRTEISELTRTFNRISQKMPVALVLKYTVDKEAVISIAISERFKYLQNWRQGEKAGKVIMLRDIHTQNTHAGHTRILLDLVKPAGVTNYAELHILWLKVLDVSILNKKFFQELSNWYFAAMNEVSFPDDLEKNKEIRNATNLIRLITRVIFIWFIKEKSLVPASLFRKEFVARIVKDFYKDEKSHNYYNAILQNLFFGTLNQKMDSRKFVKDGDYHTNIDEFDVKNLYRYANLFNISEKEAVKLFKDIPFLNGGLFDCLDREKVYVDGFSRNPSKQAKVPDYLFFGEEREVDLNEVYGTKNKRYSSKGLINLLESYKFTVAENTPLEEEIALDPELLGKVFENLLASYNPETQTTARKQTGSFYTPREIVNYMVDESLLEYLKQNLKSSPPFQGGVPEGGGGLNRNQVPEGGGGLNKNQVPEGRGGLKSSSPDLGEVSEGRRGLNNLPHLKTFRKELRNNLTPAEAKLWTLLKGKQLGRKFRSQFSVGNYILDFYCPSENLAIELDGQGHFEATQAEYDAERDLFLLHTGIKVLRFENKLVWDNPEGLLGEIKKNFGWKAKNPSVLRTAPLEGEQLLETRLRDLLSYSENPNPFNEEETKALIEAINNCKILDPACGSGAFPMGVLHKMVHLLQKLDPGNVKWKAQQKEKIIGNKIKELEKDKKAIAGLNDRAVREKAIQAVDERLKEIDEIFESKNNFDDYARKLYLIENCIYGIDIQPIAVQIAKLRFFISLVIDQKVNKNKENFGIRSLPNLETKFVAANTLIGLDKPQQLTIRNPKIDEKEKALKDLRHAYFTKNTRKEKQALQRKDQQLRKEIAALLEADGWPSTVAEQVAAFDPYDQNTSANWFDPEWMFGILSGFDVVIGNPPYVQLQKAINGKQKLGDLYKAQNYKTFERTGDIYCLFYEKGINLLKPKGVLCYITSNKWMRAGYGEKLREFFTKYNPQVLIDLGPGVFESATVDTNILVLQNAPNQNKLKAATIHEAKKDGVNLSEFLEQKSVVLNKLGKEAWFIGSAAEQKLKEKIERISKPLKEWDVKIYRGIVTGDNQGLVIDKFDPQLELFFKYGKNFVKAYVFGDDINRYNFEIKKYLIAIPKGTPIELLSEDFLALLKKRDKIYNYSISKRKEKGNNWYELRGCRFYHIFRDQFILWSDIVSEPKFAIKNKEYKEDIYVDTSAYFLYSGTHNKYFLAILNSKVSYFYFKNIGSTLGQSSLRWKKTFVEKIPLPPITPSNEPSVRQIEALVDKILAAKKQNPQANTTNLEKQIDELVYKLYELTEEEVRIVEGG
jgi:very-short-patch-repair endonuclease